MKTAILAAATAITGCAALTDPDHSRQSGAVTGVPQSITMSHLDSASGEVLQGYSIAEDYDGPGDHKDKIFAAYKPEGGAFVVVGRVELKTHASIAPEGAYVDVFWRAASDAGAGTYPCELARHGVYIEIPDAGGQFWPNIRSAHCTIEVAEVGDVGEPMRGSWTAALQQKNGTDFGTLESFSGSFDAIRDPDSIDVPD